VTLISCLPSCNSIAARFPRSPLRTKSDLQETMATRGRSSSSHTDDATRQFLQFVERKESDVFHTTIREPETDPVLAGGNVASLVPNPERVIELRNTTLGLGRLEPSRWVYMGFTGWLDRNSLSLHKILDRLASA